MLNKVMIIGRLGQDPELRYTKGSGMPVTTLNVATDENYVDRDGNKQKMTEWHRVVVFQRQAENCCNYLGKGSLVYVEGSLQTRKWQDQNGQDRYTTEIRARNVQFLDRKGERYGDGQGQEDGDYDSYQKRTPRQNQPWNQQPDYEPSGQPGGRQNQPWNNGNSGQRPGPQRQQQGPPPDEDLGPAFPSEAATSAYPSEGSGPDLDSVPF